MMGDGTAWSGRYPVTVESQTEALQLPATSFNERKAPGETRCLKKLGSLC